MADKAFKYMIVGGGVAAIQAATTPCANLPIEILNICLFEQLFFHEWWSFRHYLFQDWSLKMSHRRERRSEINIESEIEELRIRYFRDDLHSRINGPAAYDILKKI